MTLPTTIWNWWGRQIVADCGRCTAIEVIGGRNDPAITRADAEHQANEWCRTHRCADTAPKEGTPCTRSH